MTYINTGIIGCGSMGRGIATQIAATPHLNLTWVCDLDPGKAPSVAALSPGTLHSTSFSELISENPIDVLVEATNSIEAAAEYCLAAFAQHTQAVLMNAEVDLALGPLLRHEAARQNVTVTSAAGDQHGVLATLIQEGDLMGFEIVQAGNIKGFLDRSTTPQSIAGEAAKRNLSHTEAGCIRGLHCQNPRPQAKSITVVSGTIFDVAVDLRAEPTFDKLETFTLSAGHPEHPSQIYLPEGFAHGLATPHGPATIAYLVSAPWSPSDERVLAWNDPELAIPWPVAQPKLSTRDEMGLPLSTFS